MRYKINNGYYDSKLPYPSYEDTKSGKISKDQAIKMKIDWRKDERRLEILFKEDALNELGLSNHPKSNKLFEIAWEQGHSSGFSEVWNYMQTFSELLID